MSPRRCQYVPNRAGISHLVALLTLGSVVHCANPDGVDSDDAAPAGSAGTSGLDAGSAGTGETPPPASVSTGGQPAAGEFDHCGHQPVSSCTLEDTCAADNCGEPFSSFDENGCLKQTCPFTAACPICTSNDDCPAGHVCAHTVLYNDYSSSGLTRCDYFDGQCSCGYFADANGRFDCVPIEEVTCQDNTVKCDEGGAFVTSLWQTMFEIMLGDQDTPELQALAERCQERLAELEQCESP